MSSKYIPTVVTEGGNHIPSGANATHGLHHICCAPRQSSTKLNSAWRIDADWLCTSQGKNEMKHTVNWDVEKFPQLSQKHNDSPSFK